MLISYMNEVNFPGSACFGGRVPTILELQEFIENAWDLGINAQGRIETGGIRGTRKYIGTPEVRQFDPFCRVPALNKVPGASHFLQPRSTVGSPSLHVLVLSLLTPLAVSAKHSRARNRVYPLPCY